MKITSQAIHDLTGAATRLTAIMSLLRDPESRAELDPAATSRDALEAVERFRQIWINEVQPGLAGPIGASPTKKENDA